MSNLLTWLEFINSVFKKSNKNPEYKRTVHFLTVAICVCFLLKPDPLTNKWLNRLCLEWVEFALLGGHAFQRLFGTQFSIESCAKMPFITGRQAMQLNIFCQLDTISITGPSASSLSKGRMGIPKVQTSQCDSCWRTQQVRGWLYNSNFHCETYFFPKYGFWLLPSLNLSFLFRSCIHYSSCSTLYRTADRNGDMCSLHASV